MHLIPVYAVSLIATFVAWYLCILVPGHKLRGILRATVIAVLCAPGILIGHGIGVAPTLVALYLQPSVFTLGSIVVVWIIALSIIFGVPALRNDRSKWPPTAEIIFLRAHVVKFIFFGVIAATLMQSIILADQWQGLWAEAARYSLFFSSAVLNFALCFWLTRLKHLNPLLIPLLFAAPSLLIAPPVLALMWYGGGAIGGLIGSGRPRSACWVSLGVFSLLFVNSAFRVYAAATAPAHVTIGGGIIGNAVLAGVFAILAVAPWLIYWRHTD